MTTGDVNKATLYSSATFFNLDRCHRIGETEPSETVTDDAGRLFRLFQKEYGRCVSNAYIDKGDTAIKIGWVFERIEQYVDARRPTDTYMRQVWVTLWERDGADQDGRPKYKYHILK